MKHLILSLHIGGGFPELLTDGDMVHLIFCDMVRGPPRGFVKAFVREDASITSWFREI